MENTENKYVPIENDQSMDYTVPAARYRNDLLMSLMTIFKNLWSVLYDKTLYMCITRSMVGTQILIYQCQ